MDLDYCNQCDFILAVSLAVLHYFVNDSKRNRKLEVDDTLFLDSDRCGVYDLFPVYNHCDVVHTIGVSAQTEILFYAQKVTREGSSCMIKKILGMRG